MKQPDPIDNYTDSDYEDTVVVGIPRPPTPPKPTKLVGLGKKQVHLTIKTGLPKDEDSNTAAGDDSCCYCVLFRWVGQCIFNVY